MAKKYIDHLKENRIEAILIAFIVIRLLIGFFRVADYGISYDEGFGYQDLQVNDAYIREIFEQLIDHRPLIDTTGYEDYFDKMYGIAARFPLLLFQHYAEDRLQLRDIFMIHHYYQFIWFIAAVFSVYHLGRLLGFNRKASLFGCLMLVMMPRLFAEAAYDYKDILFLCLFIIAYTLVMRLLKRWTIPGMITFSVFMALCINTRYIGAVIVIIFSILFLLKKEEHKWAKLFASLLVTFVFYYIMSPFLWKEPVKGIIELVAGFNHFSWNGPVKVLGKVFPATELPWYYLISYMLVTIPLWVTLLAFAGFVISGVLMIKEIKNNGFKAFDIKRYDVMTIAKWIPGILLIGILIMDLIVHPVKYDGWRHFYFLYSMIIITALNGTDHLLQILKKLSHKQLFCALIAALVLTDLLWMEINHPYEYMYFNPAGRLLSDGYDGDYWLVSTYDAIRDVLDASDRDDIRIWFSQDMAFYFLSDEEADRLIWQTESAANADAIILHERTDFMFDLTDVDWSQYVLWKEKRVDNKLLYSIYLKKL